MPEGSKQNKNSDLFESGKRIKGKNLQIIFKRDSYPGEPLFCIAKKIYDNKPQRNRLRRLLKEAYRAQSVKLAESGYRVAFLATVKDVNLKNLKEELGELTNKVIQG